MTNERIDTLIAYAEACSKPWICVEVVAELRELKRLRKLLDGRTFVTGDHEPSCEAAGSDSISAGKSSESKETGPASPEPAAWRYKDSRGHWRYVGNMPNFDFAGEYKSLKPEPLYVSQERTTVAQEKT